MPAWLTLLSWISLSVAVLCALWIVFDIARGYRQRMGIMNIVWPVTALYAGPLAIWGYLHVGRLRTARGQREAEARGEDTERPPSRLRSVALAASHCGSGCTLADLLVESGLILVPVTLFGSEVAASWTLDFVAAFVIGIAFQYFSMRPMSDQPPLR
ncbi:DUF4396 domain-containing protein, partial [Oleiagrimonas sp.]|uniref:DUF4396 domain-containing protein n=1 Tax=Oleiagrimonas sp. TaxID=2010330 RepID=UPI00260CB0B7